MKKFFITLGFVATIMMATAPLALAVENLDTAFLPKGMPTLSGLKAEPRSDKYAFDSARIKIVERLLGVVMGSAAIIATFFIIYSGFNLVISHGEDDKMGPAKKGLTWALLGLVFIMLSYSIMSFVIKTAISAEDPSAAGESTSDQIDAGNSALATGAENKVKDAAALQEGIDKYYADQEAAQNQKNADAYKSEPALGSDSTNPDAITVDTTAGD